MYQRNSTPKLVAAVIGLAALGAIAAWEFYQFAVFKAPNGAVDLQGGGIHLWLSIGSALIGCVVGFFVFSRLVRYDKQNELHITSPGHPSWVGRSTKDA